MHSVQTNRKQHGTAESDQGEVWAEVAKGLGDLGVHSPTASLADGLVSSEVKLRACRQDIRLPQGTAGILVARGEQVIGLDLFDSPKTFTLLWSRIADAYFFDALRNGQEAAPTSQSGSSTGLQAWPGCARLPWGWAKNWRFREAASWGPRSCMPIGCATWQRLRRPYDRKNKNPLRRLPDRRRRGRNTIERVPRFPANSQFTSGEVDCPQE
ncbi:MAG: DUF6569 family protein [Thermoguttaceae bacterium]